MRISIVKQWTLEWTNIITMILFVQVKKLNQPSTSAVEEENKTPETEGMLSLWRISFHTELSNEHEILKKSNAQKVPHFLNSLFTNFILVSRPFFYLTSKFLFVSVNYCGSISNEWINLSYKKRDFDVFILIWCEFKT